MGRGSKLTILFILTILSLALLGSLMSDYEEIGVINLGPTLPLVYGSIPRDVTGIIGGQWRHNSSTRLTIYNFVSENPGIHFRGICSGLGLSVGVVQYHLECLTNRGCLTSRRERRYRRYFEARRYSEKKMEIISTLRSDTAQRAISSILENPLISHGELALILGISSQGLSWLMKRLKEVGVVGVESDCRSVRYTINDEYRIILVECLSLIM